MNVKYDRLTWLIFIVFDYFNSEWVLNFLSYFGNRVIEVQNFRHVRKCAGMANGNPKALHIMVGNILTTFI